MTTEGFDSPSHRVIHRNEIDAVCGFVDVTVPAEEQHSDMVVPVQQNQGLLVHYNKEGIQELWNL